MNTLEETRTVLERLRQSADWAGMERLSESYLQTTKHYLVHNFHILALLKQGKIDDAKRSFEVLRSYKFNLSDRLFPEVKEFFKAELASNPIFDTMRDGVGIENESFMSTTNNIAKFSLPSVIETVEEYLAVAGELFGPTVIAARPRRAVARICTFGSCFAANLAQAFRAAGVKAETLLIEESVNSTYANRYFLEAVISPESNAATVAITKFYGLDFLQRVKHAIENATDFVITVGVAPCLFDNDGRFVLVWTSEERRKYRLRTTSVEVNKDNLRRIFQYLDQINPGARKYITLSPVPLIGTTEFRSAIVADCVSKSALRAAIHEFLSDRTDVVYWPAFEVTKWLSSYTPLKVYGEEDGSPRHVSGWLVDFITRSFIERMFEGEPSLG